MNTRVIILAAGSGSRLRPYTSDRPKCLIELGGHTLLEWQLQSLRSCGLEDVIIVTGYKGDQIESLGCRTVHNPKWMDTNMVASLWCVSGDITDDVIVAYSDIIYEPGVIKNLLDSGSDISVVVDKGFLAYWKMRFNDPLSDAESLSVTPAGCIKSIGQKITSLDQAEAQYIGLMRFKGNGISILKQAIMENQLNGKYGKMFMTDLLQYIANKGHCLRAVPIYRSWLEIDTASDYNTVKQRFLDGTISDFFNPGFMLAKTA